MENIKVIDITPDNILEYGICGYKNIKTEGYAEKVSWIKQNYSNGLRIKSILTEKDGIQGMIEYIPGEYSWRPVAAAGYFFIHCLFTGFRSQHKRKGYAEKLIDICISDAREQKKNGVAVVTRKGSFMVGKEIFIKKGFEVTGTAPPDFELLALKLKKNAPPPEFRNIRDKKISEYGKGLTIIRSDQCPYTKKNVNEIVETSKKIFGITPVVIDNKDHIEAQKSPCAFGTFCIIYNGDIISHHPVSSTRFKNIMSELRK